MDSFRLSIELGNDAMQDVDDVVRELRAIADQLEGQRDRDGVIIDPNGNTVGKFSFEGEPSPADRHLAELQAIGYTESSLAPLLEVETQAHSDAEVLCSVEGFDYDAAVVVTESRVADLFGGACPNGFFVNGDPRGYTLKLSEGTGSISYRDWGGFEILAPDFD